MKFNFREIKKLVPALPNVNKLVEVLNLHLFEVDGVIGDQIDVKVLPNRYSDAASYYGLVELVSGIIQKPNRIPKISAIKPVVKKKVPVVIKAPKACRRMMAQYFEDVKVGPSPKWLSDFLDLHEIRSINNVVDITNYVTLETGQPLHAFDFDKLSGGKLIVRFAGSGETIENFDGRLFELSKDILVLADGNEPMDVAGIKGGKTAEITPETKRILLTAGTFEGSQIYKTARRLNLHTDASARFSHNLSANLAERGINRGGALVKELTLGKAGELVDVYKKAEVNKPIPLSAKEFESLAGIKLTDQKIKIYLNRLGFKAVPRGYLPPAIRTDIKTGADLIEEVVNVHGYDQLVSVRPMAALDFAGAEGSVAQKKLARSVLTQLGVHEVYLYSFVSKNELEKMGGVNWWGAVKLKNSISNQFDHLRPSLSIGLQAAAERNLRFRDSVSIFEIGKVFVRRNGKINEDLMLGLAFVTKNNSALLKLKGVLTEFFKALHIPEVDFFDLQFNLEFLDSSMSQEIKFGKERLGYLGVSKNSAGVAIAEIFFDKLFYRTPIIGKYTPPPKHPAIVRDISCVISDSVRVGDLIATAKNASSKILENIEELDFYEPKGEKKMFGGGKRSVTLRFVFRGDQKTLTDAEGEAEAEKIVSALKAKFGVVVR